MDRSELTRRIKAAASEAGFDACGVAKSEPLAGEEARLRRWLEAGRQAGMEWMARDVPRRCDPGLLVEEARSVVVCLAAYDRTDDAGAARSGFARYAWGTDYHRALKARLERVLESVREVCPEVRGRCFTDSAPLLERAWAVRAGLGWIGRSTMLVNRRWGSYTLLGEIVLDVELDYDRPDPFDGCGRCRRCLDACTAGGLTADGGLDARKCAAYLTIEHKGPFASGTEARLRERSEGWVFGCDRCLEVCPWNRKARRRIDGERNARVRALFGPVNPALGWSYEQWEALSRSRFNRLFRYTPLSRAGLASLLRNFRTAGRTGPYPREKPE